MPSDSVAIHKAPDLKRPVPWALSTKKISEIDLALSLWSANNGWMLLETFVCSVQKRVHVSTSNSVRDAGCGMRTWKVNGYKLIERTLNDKMGAQVHKMKAPCPKFCISFTKGHLHSEFQNVLANLLGHVGCLNHLQIFYLPPISLINPVRLLTKYGQASITKTINQISPGDSFDISYSNIQ